MLHFFRKDGDFSVKNKKTLTDAAPLTINLLGGFSMERNGKILTDDINRSQKLWSVLAYLVIHRDRDIPQSEFIEQFWQKDNSSNPTSALKTLLYRIRAMIEPLFGEDVQPVIARRGAYRWNPDIPCFVDMDRFEDLCARAHEPEWDEQQRLAFYREATALYRGMLLPKLSDQIWLMPLAARCHNKFVEAVQELSALLTQHSCYEELADLDLRASNLDPADENLNILAIRALLYQGRNAQALAHYEAATELLYRNFGIRASQELRSLYGEIMVVEQGLETDLDVIREELRETADRPGAFVCEYGFFREIYRLEARRSSRSGVCVHIAVLTVSMPDGTVPALKQLNATMEQLLTVLRNHLRSGDVISRYSASQYAIMLPAANLEDSNKVLERIISVFYRQHRHNFMKITYKVREVE